MTVKLNDSGATHALRLKIKQIRFSVMNRLDRNSRLIGHVYEEFPNAPRPAGASSNAEPSPTVAVRLSPADTRNFLHWVRINSSEKPSDDA